MTDKTSVDAQTLKNKMGGAGGSAPCRGVSPLNFLVELLDLGKATPLLKYVVAQEGRLLFCASEDIRIR